ncbi:MAG: hypothetical protein JSW11_22135 [Candidatus Heimdallarchaeota archaeon]|nr:MAG: hypothetical protein JSW11_22135 [Candidatus Heimdallarchaeota archaeon]
MPLPFRKKKKKKFPDPPSFYEQREKALQGPPKTPPPLPTPKYQTLEGPPKQQELKGPPRQQPDRGIAAPPNLPPPPPFARKVPAQPPQQPAKAPVPIFDDNLADEIHTELRQRDFGSTMKKTPEREAVHLSTDDLTKQHFRNSRQEYIEAGNKHLELNFYGNAATNYACAILCDLIGEGIQKARHTMLTLVSTVPSAVTENNFFDSVRLLLEAIRTKNYTFQTRAENLIKKNMGHLYPEDVAMVEKAIKTARAQFGY